MYFFSNSRICRTKPETERNHTFGQIYCLRHKYSKNAEFKNYLVNFLFNLIFIIYIANPLYHFN